jgi:RNA polymerase sigma-70 factor, ECF subfamily
VTDARTKPLDRLGDEDLMVLVARKDPAAFEAFYDRHGGAAYSLAYRIVGDRRHAEDVTQDAFLSVWKSRAAYDRTRGSVRGWILGITRHRAIDSLRQNSSPVAHLDHDDEEALAARPADELTDVEAIRRETARQVRGVLGELPAEQSEVVRLAYFGGFSQTEIASIVGAPLGTVKSRMRLALERIRARMAEGLGVDELEEGMA